MWFFDFLFPPRVDERTLRDTSDDEFFSLVAPRLVPETRPGTVALLPFHDARVRAVIHEAKYHGNVRAFKLLGAVLADYLHEHDDLDHTKVVVVPVPLGTTRQKERGYNQVAEVARRASKGSERIALNSTLLARTRETPSQVSLPRAEREKNMRGAFGAAHPLDPSYTYIVLDDVLTTGATLQAALDALTLAGATRLIPLALAYS